MSVTMVGTSMVQYKRTRSVFGGIWAGEWGHAMSLPSGRCKCAHLDCDKRMDIEHVDGVVTIDEHRCRGTTKHMHEKYDLRMKEYIEAYVKSVRYITEHCPLCKVSATTTKRHCMPFPRIIVAGSCLVLDTYAHDVRVLVQFAPITSMPDIPNTRWTTVLHLTADDPVPTIPVWPMKVSRRCCTPCKTVLASPIRVHMEACTGCQRSLGPVTIDEASEARRSAYHRVYIQNGVKHIFEAAGTRYRPKVRERDMVWRIPTAPATTMVLLQGTRTPVLCQECRPVLKPAPVPAAAPAPDVIEFDLDMYRTCALCSTVDPDMTELAVPPSYRQGYFTVGLLQYYLCSHCLGSCVDCGEPAVVEDVTMCDTCHAARARSGSVLDVRY
jgi:hypothetical protein